MGFFQVNLIEPDWAWRLVTPGGLGVLEPVVKVLSGEIARLPDES